MVFFEICNLSFRVFFKLAFGYPSNFKFIEARMVEHNKTKEFLNKKFNFKKLKLYSRVATIGLASLEHLTDRKATDFQKKSMLIGCAIAPLIDDLMDEKGYSATEIQQILSKNRPRGTVEERVCIGLLEDLERFAPGLGESEIWTKAIAYQIKSNQTIDQTIDQNSLVDNCFGKGGFGLLLGILASFPELISTKNERDAFFNVGALIQFVDDLFDVWKDREDGQQTLVTNAVEIQVLSKLFNEKLAETNLHLSSLPLPKPKINTFIFALKCYTSLGKIALTQLHNLQKSIGEDFNNLNFNRKELVTDMALLSNQIKYLRLVLLN